VPVASAAEANGVADTEYGTVVFSTDAYQT